MDEIQTNEECLRIRRRIVDMIHRAGSGHTGGSLSCVEILWTLYTHVLRYRSHEPHWPDRDRFILSKGHAAPALYQMLAEKGFVDPDLLSSFRTTGSMFQGHPDMRKVPGVEISSGSLGMGLSAGVGMCLAGRVSSLNYRVFVLTGDGELQEGQNWEAMLAASKYGLDNLTLIVDRNHVQLDGRTDDIMPLGDLHAKLASFGFDTYACDGHNVSDLREMLSAENTTNKPRAVVASTIKGKGVSFMEGNHSWHGKRIEDPDYELAAKELAFT